ERGDTGAGRRHLAHGRDLALRARAAGSTTPARPGTGTSAPATSSAAAAAEGRCTTAATEQAGQSATTPAAEPTQPAAARGRDGQGHRLADLDASDVARAEGELDGVRALADDLHLRAGARRRAGRAAAEGAQDPARRVAARARSDRRARVPRPAAGTGRA